MDKGKSFLSEVAEQPKAICQIQMF